MGYLTVFLTIGFLIFIHELGHFCAAKYYSIPVKQFAIGFGPKLWGFSHKGTEYRVSVVPVGGYVMLDVEATEGYFAFSLKQRILFSFSGPLANIIAAWAGLAVMSFIDQGLNFHSVLVVPLVNLWNMSSEFLRAIPMLISHPKQLSGIVGLVAFGGQHIGTDIYKLLSLSVMLNINLAFLNLLPILPLDGGKITLDILQRLRLPVQKIHIPLALAGWILLLGLMVGVTINDVSKFWPIA